MAAPPPSEKRQVVRYAFYKLDLAWRRLTAERQASAKLEFGETLERYNGRLLLRPYGLVGIRGDTDFLLWQVAEDLDALVELQTALNRTDLGAYLSIPYSYLAMTRRSIYEFPADPNREQRLVIQPSAAKYLFVYPFIKTRGWYALPKPERQRMMDEHVRIGRTHSTIRSSSSRSRATARASFSISSWSCGRVRRRPTRCAIRRHSPAYRCRCGTCSTRWAAPVRRRPWAGAPRVPTASRPSRAWRSCRPAAPNACTPLTKRSRSST